MLFNSIDFFVFLPIVFLFYWITKNKNIKLQNIIIVISSYIFYGWWDWRFLSLILFSTLIDYNIGIQLFVERNNTKRKLLLWLTIIINIGLLGFFKYFNFFLDNFSHAFTYFGTKFSINTFSIVLPIGISFYTLQTLSYSIDIYHRKFKPTKDYIAFSAFVCFFPQLVAGPIERAKDLLPQFIKKRIFNYSKAVDGLKQILWGLFKKIVIADNCSIYSDLIFNNSQDYSGSTLVLGALFFTFQIYCDFSGYSDIAIGTSRLFGLELKQNFNFPYFSKSIPEFWNKWHISLSNWFRDYIYIPIGGNNGSLKFRIRNIFIVFILSGLWHGANWNYIIWGVLNSVYFIPYILSKKKHFRIKQKHNLYLKIKNFTLLIITFSLTVFSWIFFKTKSITHAIYYIQGILSMSLFSPPSFNGINKAILILYFISFFIYIEWRGRKSKYAIEILGKNWNQVTRWTFYSILIFVIGMFSPLFDNTFIYFQF